MQTETTLTIRATLLKNRSEVAHSEYERIHNQIKQLPFVHDRCEEAALEDKLNDVYVEYEYINDLLKVVDRELKILRRK